MKKHALVISTAILTLALAGCTGTETEEAAKSETPTVAEGTTEVETSPGTAEDGYVGAASDVELTTCERSDDGWDVSGTATNPEEKAQSYRVYVSLISDAGLFSLQEIKVSDVAAGESKEFSETITAEAEDLDCVLRVERHDP